MISTLAAVAVAAAEAQAQAQAVSATESTEVIEQSEVRMQDQARSYKHDDHAGGHELGNNRQALHQPHIDHIQLQQNQQHTNEMIATPLLAPARQMQHIHQHHPHHQYPREDISSNTQVHRLPQLPYHIQRHQIPAQHDRHILPYVNNDDLLHEAHLAIRRLAEEVLGLRTAVCSKAMV
jgi:hypothetical protein